MPLDDLKERTKAIDIAVGQIEKQFGKGSIMRLGQRGAIAQIEFISTGSISIDYALGVGGLPRGRVIEIFGPESSGKTTLALQVIAEAQKTGGMAAFVDAEHALDAQYAQKLGVELDNLLVSQPDNGEQALEIVEVLIRSNSVDVVVVDSVAALVPKAEIEGEMGEAQMGLQARLMSQALRKLTGVVSKSKTTLIFINQLREKIGVMFGNPETTTGGRALKFYASVRIDIRRIASIKDGDQVVGGRTRVKVVKNKVAPPFREAEFDIMYGEGISREGDLLDLAVEKRIVEKSGAWFAYNGDRLGQGRENAKQFLKENPEIRQTIEDRVRRDLGMVREAEVAAGCRRFGSARESTPAGLDRPVLFSAERYFLLLSLLLFRLDRDHGGDAVGAFRLEIDRYLPTGHGRESRNSALRASHFRRAAVLKGLPVRERQRHLLCIDRLQFPFRRFRFLRLGRCSRGRLSSRSLGPGAGACAYADRLKAATNTNEPSIATVPRVILHMVETSAPPVGEECANQYRRSARRLLKAQAIERSRKSFTMSCDASSFGLASRV